MVKKLFVLIVLVGLGVFFYGMVSSFTGSESLNMTASYYAENGAEEVGAANLVTAIVVTYRGLDTLGEVTILFLTAAIAAFFLKSKDDFSQRKVAESSELLRTASSMLVPLIFTLGIYVFVNGHLTPGGGFQGGAILASGLVLLLLSEPLNKVNSGLFAVVESISGIFYVGIGVAGIILAGGFLDNSILPMGNFGT
ncbi:MAG: hydrogen gas-evolving membrane-bound hydrogenase subunit E, partial [Spirochaetota bacterium]|nr:hydrogen gas-evolving membrane-bound hydrogenase subunit E [Spirochaetota bacterium]